MPRTTTSNWRRIQFRLTLDEDGYPPASGETLWATALGDGTYRIDNIPFFATGVSLGDVVEAEMIDCRRLRGFVDAEATRP